MTGPERDVASHYGITGLYDRIIAKLAETGVAESDLTSAHIKPIDEFHIGGVAATKALLDPLGIGAATRVVDVGSGLGGTARFVTEHYGAQVTGIDLTPEFVETARRLSDALGLKVTFVEGSALDLPFAAESFDLATLIHVGMNLPDKPRLFDEVARVLTDGGTFAIYDVMLVGKEPDFPVPWAETPATSFLASPEEYLQAAEAAGFTLVNRQDRGEVARAFFAEMAENLAKGTGPAVAVPMLMGENAPQKRENMGNAVERGDILPIEMIFRKAQSA